MLSIKMKLLFSNINLNFEEFEKLIELIYLHYYEGKLNKDNFKKFNDIIEKIKLMTDFPNKLYRGLYFKDGDGFEQFVSDVSMKKEINNKNEFVSWTKDLDVACNYATNFKQLRKNDIAIVLEINKEHYLDSFVFSLYYYFKHVGYNKILRLVHEYCYKKDKEIIKKITMDNDIFVKSHKIINAMNYIRNEKEILTKKITLKNDELKIHEVKIDENNKYNIKPL